MTAGGATLESAWTRYLAALRSRLSFGGVPVIPVFILVAIILAAIFADLIAPQNPVVGNLRDQFHPPSWLKGGDPRFLLGTDNFGRDILSRTIFGARVSLIIAVVAIAFGGALGTLLGLIAGHFGGWIDEAIMRLVDLQLSLPTILVALVILVVIGSSFQVLVILIGFWMWPTYARLVRGETLRVRNYDYVALARVAGCSTWRILIVHELPAVQNSLIVMATLQAGWVILLEGSLSFLGVGVPPPTPTWGSMISDGRATIATEWWISLFPGLAMLLTCLSLNLVGDWLRDILDPKRVVV